MKKVLLITAILVSAITVAQEKITEGLIVTKQTMSSSDEQMNMQLAMMGEMVTTTYFKGNMVRTELSNPMAGDVVSVSNIEKKETLVLMNNPMYGKKYTQTTGDQPVDSNTQVEETNETKEILGYMCKKYLVKTKAQGADATVTIYATDALDNFNTKVSFGGKIKGMPLYTEVTATQMGAEIVVKNEVTEIKKEKIANDKFDMTIPEGYEKMDQALMGAGM